MENSFKKLVFVFNGKNALLNNAYYLITNEEKYKMLLLNGDLITDCLDVFGTIWAEYLVLENDNLI